MPVCAQCGTENPDVAKFCLACGSPLVAPEPGEEERKVVTAVFTDIVGSTARAESMDPEDVRAMLAPYYTRLRNELERFGGTVEKFIGDAVVAVFGAPVAHEDDPERAVRAALAIGDAVRALNEEQEWLDLHIRTAVNTGAALVVVGASAVEGEGMAAGDVMNTAARLQGAAPVDGIAVGEATFRATAHIFEYEEAEPIAAKGKAEPVPVWVVLGEKAAQTRPQPWGPLVGRDEEITWLMDRYERSRTERCAQLVTLLGPPGIGKSRLLVELANRIAPDVGMHWGRCLSYGEGITYWPITEIVRDAAGISSVDDSPSIVEKLGVLLESLPTENRDELRTIAAALSNLLGTPTTPEGTYSAEDIGQGELHWGVCRFLELAASERPLVLVFEDLHWAEPTLLELIASLSGSESALLVVGTARPELGDTHRDYVRPSTNRHVLELEPLAETASLELLEQLVGSSGLHASRFERLLEKAGGNPLFLGETVRMLADSNLLEAETEADDLPVPESLQALIGSRLDALPRGEKRVAQQASVVGSVFWQGAVAHLAGGSDGLEERLGGLERRDFIHARTESSIAGDVEFDFKHILIRDVAYDRLPKGKRAELHVRFSEWITGLPGAEHELIEILAYHLEQACKLSREIVHTSIAPPFEAAAAALARAGDRAERRGGIREADRYFARALELIAEENSETAVELRWRRARTRSALGEVNQAVEELHEAVEQGAAIGRPDLRGAALVTLSALDLRRGRADQARPHLREAETLASRLGDHRLQIKAWFEVAALRSEFDGDFEDALSRLDAAIRLAEEIDDRALRVEGHLRMGFIRFNAGDLAESERELRCCIALASDFGSHRDEARATYLLALTQYYRGSLEEAERLGRQAKDWLERTGETYFQIQNFVALAMYALARDDPSEAERWAQEAIPLALEEGGWLVVEIYRYLTEALVRQARAGDARYVAEFAGRDVPEEDLYAKACVRLSEALAAAAEGAKHEAVAAFESALELFEGQHRPIPLSEARIAYARALREFGETEAARAELRRARETLERIQATRLVAAIERELAEVTSGAGSAGPA